MLKITGKLYLKDDLKFDKNGLPYSTFVITTKQKPFDKKPQLVHFKAFGKSAEAMDEKGFIGKIVEVEFYMAYEKYNNKWSNNNYSNYVTFVEEW